MADDVMWVQVAEDGRSARVRGELDLSRYESASAALAPLFGADGDVTLDLRELVFIDSSGIRLFIRLHGSLEDGGRLVLRGAALHIVKVLEISGLPSLGIMIDGATDG
jgi:anti-sigma B factor antagonist